jgi:hypothetical protein
MAWADPSGLETRNIRKALTIELSRCRMPVCCRSWMAWSIKGEWGVVWKTRGAEAGGGSKAPSSSNERLNLTPFLMVVLEQTVVRNALVLVFPAAGLLWVSPGNPAPCRRMRLTRHRWLMTGQTLSRQNYRHRHLVQRWPTGGPRAGSSLRLDLLWPPPSLRFIFSKS